MSLDITLNYRLPHGEEIEIKSMNWLRNPFGLERWAEANTGLAEKLETYGAGPSLYYVCNHWSYDDSNNVDRTLFYETVILYNQELNRRWTAASTFWFAFPEKSLDHWIRPIRHHFPSSGQGFHHIEGAWRPKPAVLCIPMEHFEHPSVEEHIHLRRSWPRSETLFDQYMAWWGELVEFATLLKNHPEYTFYC